MKNISFLLSCFMAFVIFFTLAEESVEELYVKPGSASGHIAVVNRQTLVPESLFVEAVDILREYCRYVVRFGKNESVLKNATIQLRLIDDPTDPVPMTVSPEAGRGVLNVAALTNGLRSASSVSKFLPQRAKLEFLRMISYAFGVGGSQFSGNLLSVTSIRELDYIKPFFPVDTLDNIEKSATKRGLKPEIVAAYYEACEQGWAPAPTNAVQKAIWEKVHALPKNPITIKPEETPVKK